MEHIDKKYLSPTAIIDSDHPGIIEYANDKLRGAGKDPVAGAVKLYYAVRDGIWYDPYYPFYLPEHYRASRASGIPSRVGFGTVRNHLATQKLIDFMGSDIFVYHGFTEFYLEGQWVKSTPTFNAELCKKHQVIPLEFNGRQDSIFHSYNTEKEQFMEYLEFHGTYTDIPVDDILTAWKKAYGKDRIAKWIEDLEKAKTAV
ncbi:MAG: transglutaminase domain-containing protein [Deltaproteobacteria bacterium]|nr:transglutaminase domain-containing protein [Deltaproteobacteria bacterium]